MSYRFLIPVFFVLLKALAKLVVGDMTLDRFLAIADEEELRVDRRVALLDIEANMRNVELEPGEMQGQHAESLMAAANAVARRQPPVGYRYDHVDNGMFGGRQVPVFSGGLPNERSFGAYSPKGEWRVFSRLNLAARWGGWGY